MALIIFHVQDALGRSIAGALVQGDGATLGHWQGLTNPCGDFVATLGPDHYTLTVTANGYSTRTLPADLADCGVVTIGLESGLPLPPTHDALLWGQTTQQGLLLSLPRFGTFPWWGGAWAWLTAEERREAAVQLQGHGDTICLIQVALDGAPLYDEPLPNFYNPDRFGPLTQSVAQTVDLVREALTLGFAGAWVFLDGDDGRGNGYAVAVDEIQRLAPLMGSLNPYVVYMPGWDGVWYGYSQVQVHDFGQIARESGAHYVGIEHSTGHLLAGNGAADYRPDGIMAPYDLILGEFDGGRFDDTVWQILPRMGVAYRRPPEQPSGDDPHPPNYLAGAPQVYRVFEYHIFDWVRGQSAAVVAADKAKFEALGATHVC